MTKKICLSSLFTRSTSFVCVLRTFLFVFCLLLLFISLLQEIPALKRNSTNFLPLILQVETTKEKLISLQLSPEDVEVQPEESTTEEIKGDTKSDSPSSSDDEDQGPRSADREDSTEVNEELSAEEESRDVHQPQEVEALTEQAEKSTSSSPSSTSSSTSSSSEELDMRLQS